MEVLQMFAALTKVDEIKHEVTGVLAEEAPDKSGEIFDYESSKPFFKAWNAEFEKVTVSPPRSMPEASTRWRRPSMVQRPTLPAKTSPIRPR